MSLMTRMKNSAIAILVTALLFLPNAWAAPLNEPAKESEKKELAIKDQEGQEVTSVKNEKIDTVFEQLKERIAEEGELTEQERADMQKSLEVAQQKLKDLDSITIDLSSNNANFMEMIAGILAIILIFGSPVIIVAIVLYGSFKKRRLTHDTINTYVQSGMDIPPEVLEGLQKTANPKSNLHKGLVMVGVGLGIFICFVLMGNTSIGALGLIPLFIGLAQLLVWKLENRNGLGS